ncbi:MAG: ribosome biogenesis GTPase Der [Rickettsiales bacterium]|jgi:GTP-binding protein|nr:ribosome biogenesis GTPase Der [Rickettsiales bacterium]
MLKITIAGRPNTGKSTLFNQLTGTRDALVHDRPGVTRDAVSGKMKDIAAELTDTAGLENAKSGIGKLATDMSLRAIAASDAILFVVDGRAGITNDDIEWAKIIRTKGQKDKRTKPVLLLVNKAESAKRLSDIHDFYKLGFGEPALISAEHKTGLEAIYEFIDGQMDKRAKGQNAADTDNECPSDHLPICPSATLRVAVMGQPNVGKSTFINTVLGETRVIVKDEPGITRDTIKIPAHYYGRDLVIMDTAGLRRKAGITDDVETLSALKSLDAIEKTDMVILVVDSTRDIENQALGIAGRVYDAGKILCVALNKWDLVDPDLREEKLLKLKKQFANSFHQIIKPLILPISAEKGTGVKNLFKRIYELWDISQSRAPTSLINRTIEKLVEARQPPMSRLKRPMRIKFATQIAEHPIRIRINVGGASDIPESYTRYLRRGLAKALNWEQLPIFVEYTKTENPFEN